MKVARNHAYGLGLQSYGAGWAIHRSSTKSFIRKFFFAFTEVLLIFGFRANAILFVKLMYIFIQNGEGILTKFSHD